jgi:hypothetical protein
MRWLRLTLITAGVLWVTSPAVAQSLDGGCTVTATSDVDSTTVVDATRADPFRVNPEERISWVATSPGAIQNHTWSIQVEVGGVGVTVARGGDPNEAGVTTSEGSRSIPELVEQAQQAGVPGAGLLDGLRGIYRVSGSISGEGGSCSGDGYVLIEGSPLESPVGQAGTGVAVVGLGLTLAAGVARPR